MAVFELLRSASRSALLFTRGYGLGDIVEKQSEHADTGDRRSSRPACDGLHQNTRVDDRM